MNLYEICLANIADHDMDWNEGQIQLPSGKSSVNLTVPENTIQQADIPFYCQEYLYISDLHLEYQISVEFPNGATDSCIKSYVTEMALKLARSVPKESHFFPRPILFGGDISASVELSSTFYSAFMGEISKNGAKNFIVYAVLGNHEFWGFQSVEQCVDCYRKLFSELGVHFLHNTPEWVPPYLPPNQFIRNERGYWELKAINPDDNPEEYKRMLPHMHNTVILGGVAFAGRNSSFNAENGLYRSALDRSQEVLETKKWNEVYRKILAAARKTNSILVVLTHNPIADWKENSTLDSNCIYFCGHTHKAYRQCEWEKRAFYFADNQIGYSHREFRFKTASIYTRSNPFAGLTDGVFPISSEDYVRFNDYIGEKIAGNGVVERQIQMLGGHMLAIKQEGFYGFILISTKGTYICAGGRITKVSDVPEIYKYYKNFEPMVKKYLKSLSPYRRLQEEISKEIRQIGGTGIIHGCIVDIDTTNHVQVDPYNGMLNFYYSPIFGVIKSYSGLVQLLEEHNPCLLENAEKFLDCQRSKLLNLPALENTEIYEKLDIVNSFYAVSNRINQIQRLFDRKVLRAWDDQVLAYEIANEMPLDDDLKQYLT